MAVQRGQYARHKKLPKADAWEEVLVALSEIRSRFSIIRLPLARAMVMRSINKQRRPGEPRFTEEDWDRFAFERPDLIAEFELLVLNRQAEVEESAAMKAPLKFEHAMSYLERVDSKAWGSKQQMRIELGEVPTDKLLEALKHET